MTIDFFMYVLYDYVSPRDGNLQESDQILAINGRRVDTASHHDAISLLQQTQGTVELIVARGTMPADETDSRPPSITSSNLSAIEQPVSSA